MYHWSDGFKELIQLFSALDKFLRQGANDRHGRQAKEDGSIYSNPGSPLERWILFPVAPLAGLIFEAGQRSGNYKHFVIGAMIGLLWAGIFFCLKLILRNTSNRGQFFVGFISGVYVLLHSQSALTAGNILSRIAGFVIFYGISYKFFFLKPGPDAGRPDAGNTADKQNHKGRNYDEPQGNVSSPMVFAKLAMGDDVSIQEQERIINAVVEDIKHGRASSESLTKELLLAIKGVIKEGLPSQEAAGIFIRILNGESLIKIKLKNFNSNKIEEKRASVKIEVLDLKDELGFKRKDETAMPLFAVAYLSLEPSADSRFRIFLTRAFARENIGSPEIITQAIMHVLNKFLGLSNLQAVIEESRYNLKRRNRPFGTLNRWIIWYAAESRRYDYLLGLLKPWNEEESHSVRALRTNNSVTEGHAKTLIAQAKELSYKTAREAAIALLAASEPECLLRMSRIYSLGHDGFHTLDDRMNILAVIKILNSIYENLQAYLGPAGNRPMPNVSIYILPIIFNVLDKKEVRAREDTLFKILEFIYSFEREVSYPIPDFNKEVILGALRIAAMSKDNRAQDAACKLFHLLNWKWGLSSSALDKEVYFFDKLGRISFKAGINPQKLGLIKAGLEKILEVMPRNIIEDLKLNIFAGGAKLKVIYEDTLIQSSLLKNTNGICLNIGKDVLPEISDNLDLLLLWDLLSEGIVSLMLSDYDELKNASRTNENAYFKIGLIKALLNYKAYIVAYHKALHRQSWGPKNYWDKRQLARGRS